MSKVCLLCKKDFTSKQYNKKFCSNYCRQSNWNLENKHRKLQLQRDWRANNPHKVKLDAKSESHKRATKKWKQNNKEKYVTYNNTYHIERRSLDSNFRIAGNIRSRLSKAIKSNRKAGSAIKDLGCSIEKFKKYLESKFKPGMSWGNYGHGSDKWNIDHIKPLAKYDLTSVKQFKEACHYTNLQPLWMLDNIAKGDKYE